MSAVKNQIAAFEAHNSTVRDVSALSPQSSESRQDSTCTSNHRVEAQQDQDHFANFATFEAPINVQGRTSTSCSPKTISSVPGGSRRSDVGSVTSLPRRSDVASVASQNSATDRASQSRRTRLQMEQHTTDAKTHEAASPRLSNVSLAERRKQRQQRKAHLMQKRSSSNRHSPNGNKQQRSPRRRQPPSHPQTHRQPDPLSSNRRFVHTVSAESAESFEESPINSLRASPSRRPKTQRIQRSTTATTDYDDDTLYNSILNSVVDGTDDEATLTSVRQIMKSPQQPTLKEEPSRPVLLLRTASSSSYEADTRQLLYHHQQQQLPHSSRENDDDTLDYASIGDGEERSVRSVSRRSRPTKSTDEGGYLGGVIDTNSPLVNKEDMEHYRKSLDTPVVKTAAGVVAAATVGTILLGPVGLLVGAATVGIGIGVMQIPQEQRTNMKDKATQALHQAHESALNASETLSSTCASTCQDSVVADQLPHEMKQCFTQEDGQQSNNNGGGDQGSMKLPADMERERSDKGPNLSSRTGNFTSTSEGASSPPSTSGRSRRVACLRKVRITPVDQIHGLAPQLQPRAWLDVLANANTTPDEKSEAMEEIMILAKDKRHARFLLEEGILDSLMYMLSKNLDSTTVGGQQPKVAAACCVTLGKAHCAAVHTEGDLLLMSLYERGTVPEERQLAQMLYEVPHHVLSSTEPDVFVLQQMSMPQAEELATRIKSLLQ